MPKKRDFIDRLRGAEPVEPRGWFRWLHYHLLGRYGFLDGDLEATLEDQGWKQVAECISALSEEEHAALIPVIARHAWSVGHLGLLGIADEYWEHLSPEERGAIVAGATEEHSAEWVRRRLVDCAFSPESACEIACNAIWHKWPDVLAAVLDAGSDLRATIHRGDNGDYPKTRWAVFLEKLSHRVIDMILEAALIRKDSSAVRLALQKGADPNMPVWKLERSYNEKHCALSFAISEQLSDVAELLFEAGASAGGIDFTTPNYPLFLAIQEGWDDLAERFLLKGASLRPASKRSGGSSAQKPKRSKSDSLPMREFFGHFGEKLNWVRTAVGSIIPLAQVSKNEVFYQGNGQGGSSTTVLNMVVGDLDRLRRYEALGLDTRLTAEELCTAIDRDAFEGVIYLLGKHGTDKRDRALFRIRRRKPEFGAVCRESETLPQPDNINNAASFDPAGQPALALPDGSKLYADLDAIAEPNQKHGPCLEGHFWLRVEEATYRRRKDRVVMTKFHTRWAMVKIPENYHQLRSLLPCIKEVDRQFIRLGQTIRDVFFRIRDRRIQDLIGRWFESSQFQSVLEEAARRICAQIETARRCKRPTLSEEELKGYPTEFWPHLTRLETGSIGMTEESCSDNSGALDLYKIWERQNKTEGCFIPDPRLLSWEGWKDVPVEFRPFFEIDSILDTPTVRFSANNDYEKAMIHKAVGWKNAWMTPRILDEIEEHRRGAEEEAE